MWGSSAAWSYGSGGSSCAIRPPKERITGSARTGRSYFTSRNVGKERTSGVSGAQRGLELRRIDVLLESGHLAVFQIPDVTRLRVDALARRLVPSAVPCFNDDA